jgi:hypothetical protein
MRAIQTWEAVAINEFELCQLEVLSKDFNKESRERSASTETTASRPRFSSDRKLDPTDRISLFGDCKGEPNMQSKTSQSSQRSNESMESNLVKLWELYGKALGDDTNKDCPICRTAAFARDYFHYDLGTRDYIGFDAPFHLLQCGKCGLVYLNVHMEEGQEAEVYELCSQMWKWEQSGHAAAVVDEDATVRDEYAFASTYLRNRS